MAEEEDKKNQQSNQTNPVSKKGQSDDAQAQVKPKKKRRRRPRKRKKAPVVETEQVVTEAWAPEKEEPKNKKRRRPRKRKPKKQEDLNISEQIFDEAPAEEEVVDEDVFSLDEEEAPVEEETPVEEEFPLEEEVPEEEEVFAEEEPEIETEIETGEEPIELEEDVEEKFLASDEDEEISEESVPTEPPPELPEEVAQEGGADFSLNEEPAGPVGWNQLKDAIKKDHEESEQKIAQGVTPIPAPIPETAPESEAAPVEEIQPEPAPAADAGDNTQELAADEEAERKEIIKIITKYVIGGCAVIAIVAGIFLFKIPQAIIDFSQNLLNDGETKLEEQEEEPAPAVQTDQPQTSRPDSEVEDSTGTALLTGSQIPKVKKLPASVQTLFKVGISETQKVDDDSIATYMQVLNELQNGFETDINQLLDASDNRANALSAHLRELKGLFAEAEFTYASLKEEADELKVQYNKVTSDKDVLEEAFFVSLDKLESKESNQILNEFVEASKEQINLKARYNALNKISEMYETAMKNMEVRIKDIEVNKAALIKGVKVVDIKGSDLDLIIEEGEL